MLSSTRRLDVIAWARRQGCYILSRTTTTATSVTRLRPRSRRSPRRWRRIARSISGTFSKSSARACGSATWWCRRSSRSRSRPRKRSSTTGQSLARSGSVGRIHPQQQLRQAIACASANIIARAAIPSSPRCAAISAMSASAAKRRACTFSGTCRRVCRMRRDDLKRWPAPAARTASSAGVASGGAYAAWLSALAHRANSRRRGVAAEADRAGHRAFVRHHRRCGR